MSKSQINLTVMSQFMEKLSTIIDGQTISILLIFLYLAES